MQFRIEAVLREQVFQALLAELLLAGAGEEGPQQQIGRAGQTRMRATGGGELGDLAADHGLRPWTSCRSHSGAQIA